MGAIRCESTREERAEIEKTKAHTIVGRGEESLLSDPGSELRLGRGKEKDNNEREHNKKMYPQGMDKKKKRYCCILYCVYMIGISAS